MSPKDISKFQESLLKWYQVYQRNLVFRKTKDPYKIWLSEIMLQQTTVATVLDYYKRFIKRFPNMRSVASASEQELLTYWQGLGYYSRVRNFQKACKQVLEDHQGEIPQTAKELRTLKGVGDYTAAAISSISFNEAKAVVDGNVVRVLARLFRYTRNSESATARRYFQDKAGRILDKKNPGDSNQAMMELGATLCSKKTNCPLCPVKNWCLSFEKNPEKLPKKIKKTYIDKKMKTFVIHSKQGVLLKKPSPDNLIKNMWELPALKDVEPVGHIRRVGHIRHSITNKRIIAQVYEYKVKGKLGLEKPHQFKWVNKKEFAQIPISTLSKKVLKKYFINLS